MDEQAERPFNEVFIDYLLDWGGPHAENKENLCKPCYETCDTARECY
jgi:hypothetical protein